jgi:hypothetical protein
MTVEEAARGDIGFSLGASFYAKLFAKSGATSS